MSAWPNNGVPPTPDGAGEAPTAGPMQSGGGIVPFGSQDDEKDGRDSVPLPLVLLTCAVGGALASSTMSLAAPILVGYGLSAAHERGGMRLTALGTGISLASALALGLPIGVAQGVGSVIACLADSSSRSSASGVVLPQVPDALSWPRFLRHISGQTQRSR